MFTGAAMTDARQMSVYDGQDRRGMVIKHEGRCDAFDVYGVPRHFQKDQGRCGCGHPVGC
jgi:hypothetical protein